MEGSHTLGCWNGKECYGIRRHFGMVTWCGENNAQDRTISRRTIGKLEQYAKDNAYYQNLMYIKEWPKVTRDQWIMEICSNLWALQPILDMSETVVSVTPELHGTSLNPIVWILSPGISEQFIEPPEPLGPHEVEHRRKLMSVIQWANTPGLNRTGPRYVSLLGDIFVLSFRWLLWSLNSWNRKGPEATWFSRLTVDHLE